MGAGGTGPAGRGPPVIRAAAYCRVSTDREDQANSFESQQRYFREYIGGRPDWELYRIYADEGVTGTSTRKRTAFNQMLRDARAGAFQLILTKEVSRFSRNILDTVACTRELRTLGVGVLFLNDGISTLEPDAELRLSILGSIAQEESRRTSSRVKWGQTRRMEQGAVFGRSLLGYTVKDGSLTVNPEEAELVRLIFHKYGVEKKGTTVIARELEEAGFRTHRGGSRWRSGCLVKILKNEKYAGDLVQKKTITPDYLTHARRRNRGEEELVALRGHHQPIVSRELWDAVQAELARRNRKGARGAGPSSRYALSGKLRCGVCGACFVSRQRRRKDGTSYRRWSCGGNQAGCGVGMTLRDETALDMVRQALAALELDTGGLADGVTAAALEAVRAAAQGGAERRRERELALERLDRKREAALDAFLAGELTGEELRRMTGRYDREAGALRERLEGEGPPSCPPPGLEQAIRTRAAAIAAGDTDSEAFFRNLVDHMVVCRDRRVEVRLSRLSGVWRFTLEKPARNGAEVPMSVSSPLSSG